MKLGILVLRHSFRKYLCNRDFLEKYNAENLQDFAQTQFDFEFFLDNRHQNVNADMGTNGAAQDGLTTITALGMVGDHLPNEIPAYTPAQGRRRRP